MPPRASASPPLQFPYMVWAHEESWISPWSLSQSGMPAPDPAVLGDPPPIDLSPPAADALPALRNRLAELFATDPERVLVVPGGSGAMQVAALRWFHSGTRVVTETPSYEPLRSLPAFFGADTRVVARRPEDGWRLDPAAVERELAAGPAPSHPGHVFLSTPHNPTHVRTSAEDLVRLARAAERAGGVLVSNEVYMEFAQPDDRVHAFALADNAVSIGSLTKAYGLGALRVGWMLLGKGLARELASLTDMAYLGWVDLPTPALRLASRSLERIPALLQPARRFEAESRPLLVDWLARGEEVEGRPPELGLASFARVRGVDDTRALARFLAAEHQVDVAPGEFFGAPGWIRVGYAVPRETLAEGLRRLDEGIRAFRAAR